jgi:hypothetical protein
MAPNQGLVAGALQGILGASAAPARAREVPISVPNLELACQVYLTRNVFIGQQRRITNGSKQNQLLSRWDRHRGIGVVNFDRL